MIRLKNLITEETVFTLAPTDAWEYKYDMKNTGIPWWTRKKGTEEWIDMQYVISPDKYKQAVTTLANAIKNKTYIKIPQQSSADKETQTPVNTNSIQRLSNGYLIDTTSLQQIIKGGQTKFPKHTEWPGIGLKKLAAGKSFKIRSGIGAYDPSDPHYKKTFRGFKKLDIDPTTGNLEYGMIGGGFTNGAKVYQVNVTKGDTFPAIIKDFKVFIINWTPGATYSGKQGSGKVSATPVLASYVLATSTGATGETFNVWYPTNWITI